MGYENFESRPIVEKSSIHSTADRSEAVKNADLFLGKLPMNKALAIIRAIHWIDGTEEKKYFSLSDVIRPSDNEGKIGRGIKPLSPARTLQRRVRQLYPDVLRKYETALPVEKPDETTDDERSSTFKNKLTLRELSGLFAEDGSLIIPMDSFQFPESPLRNFFNFRRRFGNFDQTDGLLALKGLNYKVAADSKRNYFGKFEDMGQDLGDAMDIASYYNRREIDTPESLLLYLGVLDYAKKHALTIYHLLTYNERALAPQHDPEYLRHQEQALELMETTTRMYYQALLGLEYDNSLTPVQLKKIITPLLTYTRQKTGNDVLGDKYVDDFEGFQNSKGDRQMILQINERFKTPETQHPLLIALGAQEAVRKYPNTQHIVGIPSGGTEAAIVTQMLFQVLNNKITEIDFIPLSLHSGIKGISQEKLNEYLKATYGDKFKDQCVLVVDDNSPTGSTIAHTARALVTAGAQQVNTHIVDFDPTRILKRYGPQPDTYHLVDPDGSTLGITSINEHGAYRQPTANREDLAEFRRFTRNERKKIS